jgi:hypothetical protein
VTCTRRPGRRTGGEIGLAAFDAEVLHHQLVQALLVEPGWNLVDVVEIDRGDDRRIRHIGEQRDLAPLAIRDRALAAAQQDVRLDADAAQLLDRMLRRLGLHLAGGLDVRHQGQMHVQRVPGTELEAELADRLQKWQRLDVAHRAADLDDADVGAAGTFADARLNLVGDVRNHLHGLAQVVPAALLLEHVAVDLAGSDIAVAAGLAAQEAFVVPKIEVCLGAILGDEHFAMLERTHGPGIDVDVRVELDHADLEAARLENRAERGCGDALAERGHHTSGHKNVACLRGRVGHGGVRR